MIIKVIYSKKDNKIYIKSKPSHSGRDRQYIIDYEDEPSKEMLQKLQGKNTAFFHAHMKENALVIDDIINDQNW